MVRDMADEATTPKAPAPVPAPKKSKPKASKPAAKPTGRKPKLSGAALEKQNAETAAARKKIQDKQRAALKKSNPVVKQTGMQHPRRNRGPAPRP